MQLPILMYHRLQPQPELHTDLVVSVDAFQQQVKYLKQRAYQTISLSALVKADRTKKALPSQPIVITFDDAYMDVLQEAKPVLDAAGYTATVFTVTEAIGKYNFWDQGTDTKTCLNWADLRTLLAAGWEIGSHSATHVHLPSQPPEVLEREIGGSKKILEKKLGVRVQSFCYPYGAWDAAARQAVKNAGYTTACAIAPGTRSVTADPFALRRVYVKPSDRMRDFKRKISTGYLIYRAWRKR